MSEAGCMIPDSVALIGSMFLFTTEGDALQERWEKQNAILNVPNIVHSVWTHTHAATFSYLDRRKQEEDEDSPAEVKRLHLYPGPPPSQYLCTQPVQEVEISAVRKRRLPVNTTSTNIHGNILLFISQ